jgi:periplasmic protein TonB
MNIHLFIAALLVSSSFFAQETPVFEVPTSAPVPAEDTEETIYKFVEEPAEFPGGITALRDFLVKNLEYPDSARKQGIEGKCYVNFVVTSGGKVSNVRIVRGVPDCKECDAEVIRVLNTMPDWKPGRNGGKNVHSYFNLPITFSLPSEEKSKDKKQRR